jgi:hypothetical protein
VISRMLEAQVPGHGGGIRMDTIVIAVASFFAGGAVTYMMTWSFTRFTDPATSGRVRSA